MNKKNGQIDAKSIIGCIIAIAIAMVVFNFFSTWHKVTEERRIINEDRVRAAQQSGAIEVEKDDTPDYMKGYN